MGSNAGKPQINVHFYVMTAMNTEQMPREQSDKTGKTGNLNKEKRQSKLFVNLVQDVVKI